MLDYGLAKALEGERSRGSDSELSLSPTITRQGTQMGVILGTAPYMSPEQAKGKPVDRRTDVWAFGAVVFEMLTGHRAFPGQDMSEILAWVLAKEPAWEDLPQETPPALRQVRRLCLTKDTNLRVRDMADVRLAISGAFGTSAVEHQCFAARPRSPRRGGRRGRRSAHRRFDADVGRSYAYRSDRTDDTFIGHGAREPSRPRPHLLSLSNPGHLPRRYGDRVHGIESGSAAG